MRNLLPFALAFTFVACATDYNKRIKETDDAFRGGDVKKAAALAEDAGRNASGRDYLAWRMEAGMLRHSEGDYRKSIKHFEAAAQFMEKNRDKLTDSSAGFLLGDPAATYYGENFEHVLVYYYLALNHALLGDYETSRRVLQRSEEFQRQIKYDDAAYKVVFAARYLSALLAEQRKDSNTNRVMFRNFEQLGYEKAWAAAELKASESAMRDSQTANANVILIISDGLAPVKNVRGKIYEEPIIRVALEVALRVAIASNGSGLATAGVIGAASTGDNPVPEYKPRATGPGPQVTLNGTPANVTLLTDYNNMALRNFNDNYESYVRANVTALAVKMVAAAIAAEAAAERLKKSMNSGAGLLLGLAVGAGSGVAVAELSKPDLRCWHTAPSGIYMQRFALPPGKHAITWSAGSHNLPGPPVEVEVKAGEYRFIAVRRW